MTAESLARTLHAGQVDKGGAPYVEHLEAVVGILLRRWPDAPQHVVDAAWLHDALEDTGVSADALHAQDVPWSVIELIEVVSRCPTEPYRHYVNRIATKRDPWAIRIKLADLEHNSDPKRRLPDSDIVERRYAPARAVLEAALVGLEGV